MSTNPIKLFAFAGLAAVVAAGILGQTIDEPVAGRGAASTPGWVQAFFSGPQQDIPPQQASARSATPQPAQRSVSGFGRVVLNPDRAGQYRALVEIDGHTIPMLVDTGATVVALRYEDAAMLGINPSPSDFVVPIATANGELRAAPARLREARLENIVVPDVRAVVLPQGALGQSLLGMSFMSKLAGFEIAGGQLVMKP